jgi:hypothetical protein
MRRFLLALTLLAFTMPAAEAARRDSSKETAGRPAQQASQSASQRATPASRTTRTATRQEATRQQATRQQASTQRGRATARQATTRSAALRPGDARTSRSSVVVGSAAAAVVPRDAVASCTRRNGRLSCAPARNPVAGWHAGLARSDNAQTECPEGTFATLARGHSDVVRCMPF